MATSGKTKSMPARIAAYVVGALLLVLGVAFNTKSNLGISTTNSVPSVLNVVVHQHDPNTRMTLVWACNIISFVNKQFGAGFKAIYDKDAVAAEKAAEKQNGAPASAMPRSLLRPLSNSSSLAPFIETAPVFSGGSLSALQRTQTQSRCHIMR